MLSNIKPQQFASVYLEGVVVENEDPLKARRCRIRVQGVHDDVPDEHLPWARAGVFTDCGPTATVGSVYVPAKGATLLVVFQQGDPQNPLYIGGVSSSANVPEPFKTNYPNRSGWLLGNGALFYVDEVSHDLHLHHKGTTINIGEDGKVTIKVAADENIHIVGNLTAKVDGTASIDVTGNTTVKSGGATSITSAGVMTLKASKINMVQG